MKLILKSLGLFLLGGCIGLLVWSLFGLEAAVSALVIYGLVLEIGSIVSNNRKAQQI